MQRERNTTPSEEAAPIRIYAYQRIAPGLVLQPSNDRKTVYAIARYMDGPSMGLEDEPRDFTAWGWGRVPSHVMERVESLGQRDPERAVEELRDWGSDNRWPRHKTMRDAIAAALSSEESA